MQNTCPSFSCCAPPAQWSRNQVSWPESRHKSHHWTGPIQVLHSNFIWSTPSAFVFGSFLSHALHGEFCWQVNQDEKVKDIWTILHAREMCGCLDQTWENPSKGDGWENADVAQCCRDPQGSDWHKMTGSRNFKDTCCCHPYYPLHLIYIYIHTCVCVLFMVVRQSFLRKLKFLPAYADLLQFQIRSRPRRGGNQMTRLISLGLSLSYLLCSLSPRNSQTGPASCELQTKNGSF